MNMTLSKHDWPEDWHHENGMYYCRCIECKEQFIGYKRRVICKSCTWDNTTKELQDIALQFVPETKDVSEEDKAKNKELRKRCVQLGEYRYCMVNPKLYGK